QSEHAWMLGRFVLPTSRLDEFVAAQENAASTEAWRLSALLGADPARDVEAIYQFNMQNPGAVIDAIEVKVSTAQEIDSVQKLLPDGVLAYYEVAPGALQELLPTVREFGGRAKIRSGGVTEQAIPPARDVAGFIVRCARAGVAFKATAGLHHPLRACHALTYEDDSPQATMHGFINVLAASVLAFYATQQNAAMSDCTLAQGLAYLLAIEEGQVFCFTDDELVIDLGVNGCHPKLKARMTTEEIARARRDFVISFGSCSFTDPVTGLEQLSFL
ncbi:MAG TPA: hypothetical protein VF786_05725, partial [Terriglobales bacterium]